MEKLFVEKILTLYISKKFKYNLQSSKLHKSQSGTLNCKSDNERE